VQEYGRIDFIDHGIEIAFIPGCCLERVIVKGQELGVIFLELRFGPGQYIIQFIIGIEIEIILGDCILKKCLGNSTFGCRCFLITMCTFFVFLYFLHIMIHPTCPDPFR
jgi:hypothetical protein